MRRSKIVLGVLALLLFSPVANAVESDRLQLTKVITCGENLRECVKVHTNEWIPSSTQTSWEVAKVENNKSRSFVRLTARWNGLRTVGTSSVVTLDRERRVLFVDRPARALEVNAVGELITPEQAEEIALQEIHKRTGGAIPNEPQKAAEHVVMVDGHVGLQVFEVSIGSPATMTTYKVYVDAESGKVHWIHNPTMH